MSDHLTQDQVVARLRAIVKAHGTQAYIAKQIGVSCSFMSEVVNGTRPPTGKILDYLGLQSKIVYVPRGDK